MFIKKRNGHRDMEKEAVRRLAQSLELCCRKLRDAGKLARQKGLRAFRQNTALLTP